MHLTVKNNGCFCTLNLKFLCCSLSQFLFYCPKWKGITTFNNHLMLFSTWIILFYFGYYWFVSWVSFFIKSTIPYPFWLHIFLVRLDTSEEKTLLDFLLYSCVYLCLMLQKDNYFLLFLVFGVRKQYSKASLFRGQKYSICCIDWTIL